MTPFKTYLASARVDPLSETPPSARAIRDRVRRLRAALCPGQAPFFYGYVCLLYAVTAVYAGTRDTYTWPPDNPLTDLRALEQPLWVMRDGEVVVRQ